MARKEPLKDVLRALFARSGNQCAFPGCTQVLISTNNKFITQVCHIEAANPGGERYNPDQTDEERRAYENLMLMCYPHHIETNDIDIYTVGVLQDMKNTHESHFQESIFKINEEALYRLSLEMESFWAEIVLLNSVKHICEEFAVPINSKADFFELLKETFTLVDDIEEVNEYFEESDEILNNEVIELLEKLGYATKKFRDLKYFENPLCNRNWEMRNIRLRNDFTMLRVSLQQLEIKYLEEYLKANSHDLAARATLNNLKEDFKIIAKSAGLAD
jgi:hypothetical protein